MKNRLKKKILQVKRFKLLLYARTNLELPSQTKGINMQIQQISGLVSGTSSATLKHNTGQTNVLNADKVSFSSRIYLDIDKNALKAIKAASEKNGIFKSLNEIDEELRKAAKNAVEANPVLDSLVLKVKKVFIADSIKLETSDNLGKYKKETWLGCISDDPTKKVAEDITQFLNYHRTYRYDALKEAVEYRKKNFRIRR